MNKVYACVDGLANTAAVVDWAAWSALRLDVPLEFLHVLERHPERTETADYSGAIGLGSQEALLQELSERDEQRSRLAQEVGRNLLVAARERAAGAGVARLDGRLRHGDLVDAVREVEPDARLYVLGENFRANDASRIHMDHHVENVIRAVKRPVLVATGEAFFEPRGFILAFDGSVAARRMVETIAASPMLVGLPVLVAMASIEAAQAQRQLEEARAMLVASGFDVETELLSGEPEEFLPKLAHSHGAALLVMGAYGHSRVRQLLLGSTTNTLLRTSAVPVLVLR